ncbi:hypothetical protein F5887DRAFT_45434 [Amanita rubescens]|nr:hypothetical protein F5887DRAFT_45434 [Amanita rubescens]
MLFADMKACFSPSVHSTYRKAWVSHGGSLTHAESEFYEAHYFFCDGLGDPWLPDLASRRLIVRHPQWIAQCVSERAIMPIAAFTLDSRFESEVIESTQRISQEFIESYKVPGRPGSDVSETSANNSSRHKTNLRKRPLLDDTVERARVVKRSRIFTGGDTPVTPLKPCLKSSLLIPRSPEDEVKRRYFRPSPNRNLGAYGLLGKRL